MKDTEVKLPERRPRGQQQPRRVSISLLATLAAVNHISLFLFPQEVASFSATTTNSEPRTRKLFSPRRIDGTLWASANGGESDEIEQQLERARIILEKSKAKLAAREDAEGANGENGANKKDGATPSNNLFFASSTSASGTDTAKRDLVTKSTDEKTGLITTDGEKMAKISEEEEWESRPLLEVFENNLQENEDVYSEMSEQLASKDVAMSIFNLRKEMKTEDYRKIFDKRCFFIGEDT